MRNRPGDGLEEMLMSAQRGKTRNRGSIFLAIETRHGGENKGRRVSTMWAPDDEIANHGGVNAHNQTLLMPFEVEGGDVKDYQADGDTEMDTPENLSKRQALRSNKRVEKILKKYFKTCSSARRTGSISKEEYIYFHIRIAKALIVDDGTPSEITKKAAEEEWSREVNILPMMPQSMFLDSVFEIADIWTAGIDADEYVDFLKKLYSRVTVHRTKGNEWKEVKDITGPDMLEETLEAKVERLQKRASFQATAFHTPVDLARNAGMDSVAEEGGGSDGEEEEEEDSDDEGEGEGEVDSEVDKDRAKSPVGQSRRLQVEHSKKSPDRKTRRMKPETTKGPDEISSPVKHRSQGGVADKAQGAPGRRGSSRGKQAGTISGAFSNSKQKKTGTGSSSGGGSRSDSKRRVVSAERARTDLGNNKKRGAGFSGKNEKLGAGKAKNTRKDSVDSDDESVSGWGTDMDDTVGGTKKVVAVDSAKAGGGRANRKSSKYSRSRGKQGGRRRAGSRLTDDAGLHHSRSAASSSTDESMERSRGSTGVPSGGHDGGSPSQSPVFAVAGESAGQFANPNPELDKLFVPDQTRPNPAALFHYSHCRQDVHQSSHHPLEFLVTKPVSAEMSKVWSQSLLAFI
jgi:hypothetical protein